MNAVRPALLVLLLVLPLASGAQAPAPQARPEAPPAPVAPAPQVQAGTPPAPAAQAPVVAAAPAPEASAPGLSADDALAQESAGWMLLRTLVVLGVVLASIYLTLNVGLRRLMGLKGVQGRSGRAPLVTVLERHPLGPKQSLLVVRAGGEYLLVGATEHGLSLLSKLEGAQVAQLEAEAQPSEGALAPIPSLFLQKLLARRAGPGTPPPAA